MTKTKPKNLRKSLLDEDMFDISLSLETYQVVNAQKIHFLLAFLF